MLTFLPQQAGRHVMSMPEEPLTTLKPTATYKAYADSINTFLQNENTRKALSMAQTMYRQALQEHSNEGLYLSHLAFAKIYSERDDSAQIISHSEKAIEYAKRCTPRPPLTKLYHTIYDMRIDHSRNSDLSAVNLLYNALAAAQTREDSLRSYIFLAYHYGHLSNEGDYDRMMRIVNKMYRPEYVSDIDNIYYRAASYHYMFSGKTDSAMLMRKKISDAHDRFEAVYNVARYVRPYHYKEAVEYGDSIDSLIIISSLRNENAAMVEFTAMLENSEMKEEAEQHKANIAKAKLTAAREQLQEQQSKQAMQHSHLENEQLQHSQRKKATDLRMTLENIAKQKMDFQSHIIAQSQRNLSAEHTHNRNIIIYLTFGVIFLIILIGLLLWWNRRAKQVQQRMAELNHEQELLRNIAIEASSKKDEFIRNMSYEVRQPLNNVSGFAQLLAQTEVEITDAEREEYGALIQQESLVLTDYINSILNSSSKNHKKETQTATTDNNGAATNGATGNNGTGISDDNVSNNSNNANNSANGNSNNSNNSNNANSGIGNNSANGNNANSGPDFNVDDVNVSDLNDEESLRKYLSSIGLLKAVPLLMIFTAASLFALSGTHPITQHPDSLLQHARVLYTQNHTLEALRIARDLNADAHRNNDIEMRYKLYKLFADIFLRRNSVDDVVPNLKKAIEMNKLREHPENPCMLLIAIADHAAPFTMSFAERIGYLQQALDIAPNDYRRANALIRMAGLYGSANDTTQFHHYYDIYKELAQHDMPKEDGRTGPIDRRIKYARRQLAMAYEHYFNGEADKAFAVIQKLPKANERYELMRTFAILTKDYKRALLYRDSLTIARNKAAEERNRIDRQDIETFIGKDSIAHVLAAQHTAMQQMEAEHQQQILRQQQLQNEKARQAAERKRLKEGNDEQNQLLSLRKKAAQRHEAQIKRQQMIIANESMLMEQREMRYTNQALVVLITLLIAVVLVFIVLQLWRRFRTMQLMHMTQEMHEMQQAALYATDMKDVFIQNMSHEIRTPLNAISGFSQLLALPAALFSQEERQQFAKHVDNNIHLLQMLLDDILNIGEIEKGNYSITLADCNANEMARIAMSTIEYRVQPEVLLSLETDLPDTFMLHTDGQRVQQVLINYLTNAIKHTQQGTIKVCIHQLDAKTATALLGREVSGAVQYSVADTGTGIPAEQAENIFERFVKLNDFVQGTGLGLNICRIIAEKLEAKVALDTTYPDSYPGVDHGARFILVLPMAKS